MDALVSEPNVLDAEKVNAFGPVREQAELAYETGHLREETKFVDAKEDSCMESPNVMEDVSENTVDVEDGNDEYKLRFNMFINFDQIIDDLVIFKHIMPEFNNVDVCENTKKKFVNYVQRSMTHFGTNITYQKYRNNIFGTLFLMECNLPMFNPFVQLHGFKHASALLHAYWNKLDQGLDYVGFSEYNLAHKQVYDDSFLDQEKHDFYFHYNPEECIVTNGEWSEFMKEQDADYILDFYNKRFDTSYTKSDLEGLPDTKKICMIYPTELFKKVGFCLSHFYEQINKDISISPFGNYYELCRRCISIFHAIQILEKTSYKNLDVTEEQYTFNVIDPSNQDISCNIVPFKHVEINQDVYEPHIRCKFIDNITTTELPDLCSPKFQETSSLDFSVSKSLITNRKTRALMLCDNISVNGKLSLLLTDFLEGSEYKCFGEGLDPQNPRLVNHDNKVKIVFDCYQEDKQKRCTAITTVDEFDPLFLELPPEVDKNIRSIEWAPFIKDEELHFICSYQPLVVTKLAPDSSIVVVYDGTDACEASNDVQRLLGGTNFEYYKGYNYIGQCYSQEEEQTYVHTVILDTLQWKLDMVSKPLMYIVPLNKVSNFDVVSNTSILSAKVQKPISINRNNGNKFMTTVSFDNKCTYIFDLCLDL